MPEVSIPVHRDRFLQERACWTRISGQAAALLPLDRIVRQHFGQQSATRARARGAAACADGRGNGVAPVLLAAAALVGRGGGLDADEIAGLARCVRRCLELAAALEALAAARVVTAEAGSIVGDVAQLVAVGEEAGAAADAGADQILVEWLLALDVALAAVRYARDDDGAGLQLKQRLGVATAQMLPYGAAQHTQPQFQKYKCRACCRLEWPHMKDDADSNIRSHAKAASEEGDIAVTVRSATA
ncbi:hypothetical protein JKP88DRAFT_253055 [Tribonema minus]|uniref:Uncharacterized protein n=1 Tax=Tribonema minus TaxID=303371 RepID=A0A836CMV6_9STRA|nr:hypothetical protein JKP88DRAFT_253055 [Tribonema minus]